MRDRYLVAIFTLFLAGCNFSVFNKSDSKNNTSEAASNEIDAEITSDQDGIVTAKFDPNLSSDQAFYASKDGNLAGSKLVIPAQALSEAASITLEEGVGIIDEESSGELGVDNVSDIGPALMASSSADIETSNPFSISLATGTQSLSLNSTNIFVAYLVETVTGDIFLGVLPISDLTVDNGQVSFQFTFLRGFRKIIFQSAFSGSEVAERKEVTSTKPLKSQRDANSNPPSTSINDIGNLAPSTVGGSNVTISGTTSTSEDSLDKVEVSVKDSSGKCLNQSKSGFSENCPFWISAGSASPWSFNVPTDTLNTGTYDVSVRGTSTSGVVEDAEKRSFSWDEDGPPPPTISSPSGTVYGSSQTVNWTPGNAEANVSYEVLQGSDASCSSPQFQQTVSATSVIISGISDGTHYVCISAIDAFGNKGSSVNSSFTKESWLAISTNTLTNAERSSAELSMAGDKILVFGGASPGGISSVGMRYDLTTSSWLDTASAATVGLSYRRGHSMVSDGTKIFTWGGDEGLGTFRTDGSAYNPGDNSNTAISNTGSPSGRSFHTAIWDGNEMLVWGGYNAVDGNCGAQTCDVLKDGFAYDPVGNSWSSLPAAPGGLSYRFKHTAVWTGSEMIVWGGCSESSDVNNALCDSGSYLNDGAKFDGSTWTMLSSTNAPSARAFHRSVVISGKMLVWGGFNSGGSLGDGAIYDPVADTWTTISTTNAPTARNGHVAVSTGSKMIVWGGGNYLNTGAVYDLSTDTWQSMPTTSAPLGRTQHTAIWTGSAMFVYGGIDSGFSKLKSGALFFP